MNKHHLLFFNFFMTFDNLRHSGLLKDVKQMVVNATGQDTLILNVLPH